MPKITGILDYIQVYTSIYEYIQVYTVIYDSDVASHALVVCQLRKLKKGCKLTGMKVVRVELRLVGGARRNANDSK